MNLIACHMLKQNNKEETMFHINWKAKTYSYIQTCPMFPPEYHIHQMHTYIHTQIDTHTQKHAQLHRQNERFKSNKQKN